MNNKHEKLAELRKQALLAISIHKKELKEMMDDESIPKKARLCIGFSLGEVQELKMTLDEIIEIHNVCPKFKDGFLMHLSTIKAALKEMAHDESIPPEARMCILFTLGMVEESGLTLVNIQ